jgi:hypothetical protein
LAGRSEFVDIRAYRSDRRKVVALLNTLLKPLKLGVQDWDGEAFIVFDATGRSLQAAHLNDLWRQVERMTGRAHDPLAEDTPCD